MSTDDITTAATVYSPLLERLKELQVSQQQQREISRELISNIVKSPPVIVHCPVGVDLTTLNKHPRVNNSMSFQFTENEFPHSKLNNKPFTLSNTLKDISRNVVSPGYPTKSEGNDLPLSLKENCLLGKENIPSNVGLPLIVMNGDCVEKSISNFKYLKKGQGLQRYKVKPLKGFRKQDGSCRLPQKKINLEKSLPVNSKLNSKTTLDTFSKHKTDETNWGEMNKELMGKENNELNAFERLEELVDQESFTSTSSKVMQLLQEADNSTCSTPLSSKVPPISEINVTPIFCDGPGFDNFCENLVEKSKGNLFKSNSQMLGDGSPLTKGFSKTNEQMVIRSPNNKISRRAGCTRHVNNYIQAGILKKLSEDGLRDASCRSLFAPKVKFLEQGAKVLEYDESEAESNNSRVKSFCSDDSDLISVSDLESLAYLNFNVQVIHEVSMSKEDTMNDDGEPGYHGKPPRKYFPNQRSLNSYISSISSKDQESNAKKNIQEKQAQFSPSMSLESSKLVVQSQSVAENVGTVASCPQTKLANNISDNDTKTCKLLLLSKVEELNKEIAIFKKKNASLEKLMRELQEEKQKMSARNELHSKINKSSIIKSRKFDNVSNRQQVEKMSLSNQPKAREAQDDFITMKLQKLNEKVNHLMAENKGLKEQLKKKKQKHEMKTRYEPQPNMVNSSKNCVSVNLNEEKFGLNPKITLKNSVANKLSKNLPQSYENYKLSLLPSEDDEQLVLNSEISKPNSYLMCNEEPRAESSKVGVDALPVNRKEGNKMCMEQELLLVPQFCGSSNILQIPDTNNCRSVLGNTNKVEDYLSGNVSKGTVDEKLTTSFARDIPNAESYESIARVVNSYSTKSPTNNGTNKVSNPEEYYAKNPITNPQGTQVYQNVNAWTPEPFCVKTKNLTPFNIQTQSQVVNVPDCKDESDCVVLGLKNCKDPATHPYNSNSVCLVNLKSSSCEYTLGHKSSSGSIDNQGHINLKGQDGSVFREINDEISLTKPTLLMQGNCRTNHAKGSVESQHEANQSKRKFEICKKSNLFTINEESEEELSNKSSPSSEVLKNMSSCGSHVVIKDKQAMTKGLSQGGSPQTLLGNSSSKSVESSFEIIDVFSNKECCTDEVGSDADVTGSSVFHFPNGDKKTIYSTKIVYYYCTDHITHTYYNEGMEVIEFPNGQKETYFQDGSCQVLFPDNSSKSIYKDGTEIFVSGNGSVTRITKDGVKTVEFPNGQKEIFESDQVRRIYPDGTVKILYANGEQETRYNNGMVRIKDKEGNVVMRNKNI